EKEEYKKKLVKEEGIGDKSSGEETEELEKALEKKEGTAKEECPVSGAEEKEGKLEYGKKEEAESGVEAEKDEKKGYEGVEAKTKEHPVKQYKKFKKKIEEEHKSREPEKKKDEEEVEKED
ncbi:MAG: hypothetical protein KAT94_04385, partial [Candidatus Aenigmarchaeota archaeon]|nr:hypothetical protein [Candidatus Aenigmarchaeota archaeon]